MADDRTPPDDLDLTLSAQPPDTGLPAHVGPYRILQKIGEGGMGEVYLAEQEKPIRRRVALKLIKLGMDTRQVVARFESERQALAIMNHPHVAKIFDAGATDAGRPYFAMEYVSGEPISTYCNKHRLTTRERLELFMQVCDGIQHAHQKGIIHRDLKPSNVLVQIQDNRPAPKIIDFGVAKATQHRLTERTVFTAMGALIGTPEYMSPEQAEMSGLDVDARTDIYSLGVLLYELLTGTLPFQPKRLRQVGYGEIQRIIREEDPPTPSNQVKSLGPTRREVARDRHTDIRTLRRQLRGDLDSIVMKALEKDRTRRYASAAELADDVARYLRNERVVARGRWSSSRRWSRLRLIIPMALALGVAGIFLASWPATATMEGVGLDLLFLSRGSRPAPTGVCVIAVDGESFNLRNVDPLTPWPRDLHGELVRVLAEEGARAVAFDILFMGAQDPRKDEVFESSLAQAGNVVLASFPEDGEGRRIEPYGRFMDAAATVGDADYLIDRDGVIRSASLFDGERPSLALAAYEVATGDKSPRKRSEQLLDYYGPARTISTVSLYQALEPGKYLRRGYFNDKIVFVGLAHALPATDPANSKDTFSTPFRKGTRDRLYSTEIYATLAANLLEGRRIARLTPVWEAAWILLLTAFATLTFASQRPVVAALSLVGLEILLLTAGYLFFAFEQLWLPLVIPAFGLLPAAYLAGLVLPGRR